MSTYIDGEQHTLDPFTLHLLQQTQQFFLNNQQQAYLVGGSVRNMLLHERCSDWDIVIGSDAARGTTSLATSPMMSTLSRRLADTLGGFYAHLHSKASRVVVKHDEQELVFDISPLQGGTLEADLHLRDFTLNAIAVPLIDAVRHFETGEPLGLIDPLHGVDDLKARRLRAVDDNVFRHDPLRMLRALRFLTHYALTLDTTTEQMLRRDAQLLLTVAPERIHAELYTLLEADAASSRLHLLDDYGLLTVLMPEFIPARGMPQPGLHHWDVLDHSLETVAALERLANTLQQPREEIQHARLEPHGGDNLVEIQELLLAAEQQGIFRFATLPSPPMKLAALLHDIGKTVTYTIDNEGMIRFYGHPQAGVPLAQELLKRLSVSTADRRLVQQIVANHMRPGQLSRDTVTQRAIRRYFVELGPTGILVALISLADHLAMRGPAPLTEAWERHLALVRLLLTRYIRERTSLLPPRLLQPEELMRRLDLPPGPLVGKLLEAIAEAQADGTLQSKDDAVWFAQEKLTTFGS